MIVNNIQPQSGAEGVALGSPIVITFNDVVDETTINDGIYIEKVAYTSVDQLPTIQPFSNTERIEYNYEIDNSNGYTILTIRTKELFDKKRKIRVFITNNLLDQSGTPLEDNYMSWFITTDQDIIEPPSQPSTTIGYLPDLSDVFTDITTTQTTGLNIAYTSPQDESWGYDSVDDISFKFNDLIDTSECIITIKILDLDTLQTTTLESGFDYTTTTIADTLTIHLIEPIIDVNKKIIITLQNIKSVTNPEFILHSYSYEIVTNFYPINADVGIVLAEAANLSNADSYYLMHIIFYASKEADLMTQKCNPNDPTVVYYKQRWVMAKVLNDLLSRVVQSAGNLFTTEKTIAYVTIKRQISQATLPNTLDRTLEELKRYELPLLTCGELLPDSHLKPTNALIYGNSKNVSQSGRLPDSTSDSLGLNQLTHANDDIKQYFIRTYQRGEKTYKSDREE